MNGTTVATLQYYTPGVYNVLADVVMSAFLFGESNATFSHPLSVHKLTSDSRLPNGALDSVYLPLDVGAIACRLDIRSRSWS